jgi:hypothetical protein
LRVPVEGVQAARRTERRENCARMSAAAVGRIDVRSLRTDRQRGDGFFEQDGDVLTAGHQRLKPSSSGGRPPEGTRCSA